MGVTIARQERQKVDGLTTKQRAFVRQFVEMGCGLEGAGVAAIAAGYAEGSTAARRLLEMPSVREAVRVEQRGKLRVLANKALDVVADIMRDEEAPPKVRLDASKVILDRAGLVATQPEASDPADSYDRPVSEMTREELRALLEEARAAMADAAPRVINDRGSDDHGEDA
ncbi:terminase small subunit [Methyloversatilis sp.]|uniref:terminase small subunit n=1 Tax=Methyloversatilis sp. TaxID=2569862 RepID=UPI0035AE7F8C